MDSGVYPGTAVQILAGISEEHASYSGYKSINSVNSVDLVVIPSLQENLSNMIMESLSCGVSVVAFQIEHNGDDPQGLAKFSIVPTRINFIRLQEWIN
jgi:hypothetical protein